MEKVLRDRLKGWGGWAATSLGLALLYFAAGRLGLSLAFFKQQVTLVWPPSGIAVAAVFLLGYRCLPGIMLGAFLTNHLMGSPLLFSCATALGNPAEAFLAVYALRRFTDFRPSLERSRDALSLIFWAALLATLVSPSIGTVALILSGLGAWSEFGTVWLGWWLGDSLGILTVTPLLLVWFSKGSSIRLGRLPEAILVFVGIVGISIPIYFGGAPGTYSQILSYFIFPLLVWAAYRLGPRGAITAAFVGIALAVWGTSQGQGPFAEAPGPVGLLHAYILTIQMALGAMLLAAVFSELREARWQLERHQGELEDGVASRTRALEAAHAQLVREMAERERLQVRIQQAQRLESLAALAGGVAHDFNNLLQVIKGHTEIATAFCSTSGGVKGHLDKVIRAADRAADLSRKMLAFSGKGRFVVQPLDLSLLVHDLGHLLEATLPKNAVLDFALASDLPEVEADKEQIQQLVMNLLLNASEAIGEGEGRITLSTGVKGCTPAELRSPWLEKDPAGGTYVFLEVRDTGCGMESSIQSKIFDPFFTTKFHGRGLGLSAALGIVRGHHGAIQVQSAPGQGATFRVYFPASVKPVATPSSIFLPQIPAVPGKPVTVMVVDDEEDVRELAGSILERAGFQPILAQDGMQALERLEAGGVLPDLVLLDLTMPRMDGEEVLRRIVERCPALPVIMCSGYHEGQVRRRLTQQGAAAFLAKPYGQAELLELIGQVTLARTQALPGALPSKRRSCSSSKILNVAPLP